MARASFAAAVALAVLGSLSASHGAPVTISNVVPRRDTSNAILDAHDSKLNFHAGLYYWHAASYGNCTEPKGANGCAAVGVGNCGFQTDHNVTLYTSPDLVTWTNAGIAFSATGNLPPHSVLFAPKTVYNAQTQQWVMVRCARENQRTFGVRWRYWRALAGVAGAASICCCVNERPRSHAPPSLALPPVV